MKKLLLSILLFYSAAISMRAADNKALILELEAGTKMTFVLSEKPEMTFANGKLMMTVNNSATQFQIADVKQFYFADANTGIAVLKDNELRIVYKSTDKVIVEGIGKNDKVRVYTVSGILCNDCVSTISDRAEISLSSLPKGIYIIDLSNRKTLKIRFIPELRC